MGIFLSSRLTLNSNKKGLRIPDGDDTGMTRESFLLFGRTKQKSHGFASVPQTNQIAVCHTIAVVFCFRAQSFFKVRRSPYFLSSLHTPPDLDNINAIADKLDWNKDKYL